MTNEYLTAVCFPRIYAFAFIFVFLLTLYSDIVYEMTFKLPIPAPSGIDPIHNVRARDNGRLKAAAASISEHAHLELANRSDLSTTMSYGTGGIRFAAMAESLDLHAHSESTHIPEVKEIMNTETGGMVHSFWHVIGLWPGHVMHVVRGYLDERRNTDTGVSVRIIAQSSNETHTRLLNEPLFCSFVLSEPIRNGETSQREWPEGKIEVSRAATQALFQHRMTSVNGVNWTNTYITCPVSGRLWEYDLTTTGMGLKVSFSVNASGDAHHLVPVLVPDKPPRFISQVGMCLGTGTLHGYLGDGMADWLIEWFETNRLLGIHHFHINNGTAQLSAHARRVFEYYEQRGVLTLYQHPPPVLDYQRLEAEIGRDVADIGMRTALNDCIYRNMYRYKFIAVFDLDEIIMPERRPNFRQLLLDIYPFTRNEARLALPELPSVVFRSRLYCQIDANVSDLQVTSNETDLIITSQRLYARMAKTNTKKVFLNPRLCIFAHTHGCLRHIVKTPKRSILWRTFEVLDVKHAFVHHYRASCDPSRYRQDTENNATYYPDEEVGRFAGDISIRVKRVRESLELLS